MKRSRIGNTDVDVEAYYWSGGKDTHELRRSEIFLYSKIDLLQEKANICTDETQIQAYYNEMDIYFAAIKCIESYGDQADLLQRAGVVLGNMIEAGDFAKSYESLDLRNEAVNELIESLFARTSSFNETAVISDFANWYGEHVLDCNFYFDMSTGEKSEKKPVKSAIGATTYGYDFYSAKAKESGHFWLYSVADIVANEPMEVKAKRISHVRYFRWFETYSPLNQASIKAVAESGIINKSGMSANANRDEFIKAGSSNIGVLGIDDILVICVVALSALARLAIAIKDLVVAWNGEEYYPTESELNGNAASISDWNSYAASQNYGNSTTSEIISEVASSPIAWIGLGLLAIGLISYM